MKSKNIKLAPMVLAVAGLFSNVGCSAGFSAIGSSTSGAKATAISKLTLALDSNTSTALSIIPSLPFGDTLTAVASGGVPPYNYYNVGCDSTIDSASGLFVAAHDVSTCQVTVSDSTGAIATATANVVASLSNISIAIPSITIMAGEQLLIAHSGGVAPYSFSVTGCDSTIGASSGLFSAASDVPEACFVTVSDSLNATASETINVVASTKASPTPTATPVANPTATPAPTATPSPSATPCASATPSPTATPGGGSNPPHHWGPGGGNNPPAPTATPVATPASTPMPTPVPTPVPLPLLVSPAIQSLNPGASIQIVAQGGTAPYAYSVRGCTSGISTTGLFTADTALSSLCLITVYDSAGQSADSAITIAYSGQWKSAGLTGTGAWSDPNQSYGMANCPSDANPSGQGCANVGAKCFRYSGWFWNDDIDQNEFSTFYCAQK